MTVEAFDLAERLQTPIIIMSDLDLGMNEWMSPPLEFDDSYRYDRGKVLNWRGTGSDDRALRALPGRRR